ncbi:MAG: TIGR03087 family PEP-CTERM/XrtA system glycosyltransferase [Erythrobacter sp.]|nr:TIGR03087 family PEP-CTERM/XrtA system glycosyltransferase [Erythrobacter sp.]
MGDILFLAHRVPFPPDRGDKIRSHHLLKGLAKLGRIHVGTFAETEQDRAQEAALADVAASYHMPTRSKPLALAGMEALVRRQPVSLTAFHDKSLAAWVQQTLASHRIDTIVIFSGQMGQYVPADFTGEVVIDLCDVDSAKFTTYKHDSGFPRSWLYAREAEKLAAEEVRLARIADTTLLITEKEADILRARKEAEKADIQALGNGVDTAFFDPARIGPHPALKREAVQIVFTGQMDYLPNVAAVERFAARILPLIRQKRPADFHIVGRAPTADVTKLGRREGVTVWGEVPDVRPFLRAADAVVAPLMLARGVQNKVLEAMAMARPVLVSAEAATGIEAEDGKHWHICRDDEAFVRGVLAIAEHADRADHMGQLARRFVVDTMSWESVQAELAEIVGRADKCRHHAA